MDDLIQTSGKLFEEVQKKAIFPDSKTFVDSIPLNEPERIVEEYEKSEAYSRERLRKFVADNFELPENRENQEIKAKTTREYIEKSWNAFSRQPDRFNPESSLIPLKKSYVVPGGRFREIYYWDTLFIIIGLINSDKNQKALDCYENLMDLVEKYGFIPNGNRKYYLTRSQPPVQSLIKQLLEKNGIKIDQKHSKEMLEKELSYWNTEKKSLKIEGRKVYRYYDEKNNPRPESYREDRQTAEESDREEVFREIRTGAESGWDFSSRWCPESRMENIRTTEIIPVDLNCMIYGLKKELGKNTDLKHTVDKIFWDEEREFYFDYDMERGQKSNVWSLAATLPLFYKISSEKQAEKVKETIEKDFLTEGGLKTTLSRTGMQWDAPNGWAPLHWFAVRGLQKYEYEELAEEIASRWVQTCREGFRKTGNLMEKYNVEDPGKEAQDGEYRVQKGFGWTNGVTLDFMERFNL